MFNWLPSIFCVGKRKPKIVRLNDIVDDEIRDNPYDDTNPLYQKHVDENVGVRGDSDGGDSLDGDILIDDDDDFEA